MKVMKTAKFILVDEIFVSDIYDAIDECKQYEFELSLTEKK